MPEIESKKIAEERRPVEEWATLRETPAWQLAGLKALRRWAQGQEVTEDAFDRAAFEAANIPIGGGDRYAVK